MPVITYREALNQALREEMRRDPKVFLMGEDVPSRKSFIQSNAKLAEIDI